MAKNSCVYHIQLRGQVDIEEVNEMSPLLLESSVEKLHAAQSFVAV